MAKAKSIGWAIYVAGFVIWLFGYLSPGHAAAFDWDVATPSWISSFVPNLEAELGLALMFASMIPIYWRASSHRHEHRSACGLSRAWSDGVRVSIASSMGPKSRHWVLGWVLRPFYFATHGVVIKTYSGA
jgi:hypothetical protein